MTTHGKARSPEYRIWTDMKTRCFNKNAAGYNRYGGRGITVCDRWKDAFEKFLADMGPRPFPEASLDRVDNNGNYEPGNCVWTTAKEQARNRRTSKRIIFQGRAVTIAEAAEMAGAPYKQFWKRLKKSGATWAT